MNCPSQYVRFTFSRMEHQFILLERCEAGQMKFFLGNGMGAGDQPHGYKDPQTSYLYIFLSGVI